MTIGTFHLAQTCHVMVEAVVGAVDDLVHRERHGGGAGIVAVPGGKRLADLVKPFVQHGFRPRVERGKAADDA